MNKKQYTPMQIEEEIKKLLRETKIEGIEQLIKCMKDGGFFEAPCSTSHHLAQPFGLAEHSLNVYECLDGLVKSFDLQDEIPRQSIIIAALLHDLGKMGDYGKQNYQVNLVRSKTKNKETGEYDLVQSTAKPYITNPDLIYEEHEIRSVKIAAAYIHLSEQEAHAILHHNGLYGKLDSPFSSSYDKTKLSFLLHTADMYCSRFIEEDEEEE